MANCHFITKYIIDNSRKQRITTFCCQISYHSLFTRYSVATNEFLAESVSERIFKIG